MGIIASALCCCTSCAISSATCCCTTTRGVNSMGRQAAKGSYVALLGVGVLISWLGQRYFRDVDFEFQQLDFKCDGSDGDNVCSSDGFVYRCSFMMSVFFLLMLLGNVPFPTLEGERRWRPLLGDGFQNGCWAVKILLFLALLVCVMFLPSSFFDSSDNAWAWACRIASSLFIIIQVFLLIDFGYQVNEDWVYRAYGDGDEAESKGWLIGLIVFSLVLTGVAIGGIIAIFVVYDECAQGRLFNIITTIAVAALFVITLFRDQLVGEPGAVFPTSVVCAYAVYLVWSATESIPDVGCRPFDDGSDMVVFIGIAFASVTLVWASYTASKRFTNLVTGDNSTSETQVANMGGLYAIGVDENGKEILARDKDRRNETEVEESSNPNDSMEDKPWLFHVFMITGAMYSAMLLTNWGVDDPTVSVSSNDAIGKTSMWVKIISQWITIALYLWTLIAPRVLHGREFS